MAVAHVADIVRSRIDAGLIARTTDPQLSARVLSWRIAQFDTPQAAWAFQPPGRAWDREHFARATGRANPDFGLL